jgi:hypothetical protein
VLPQIKKPPIRSCQLAILIDKKIKRQKPNPINLKKCNKLTAFWVPSCFQEVLYSLSKTAEDCSKISRSMLRNRISLYTQHFLRTECKTAEKASNERTVKARERPSAALTGLPVWSERSLRAILVAQKALPATRAARDLYCTRVVLKVTRSVSEAS